MTRGEQKRHDVPSGQGKQDRIAAANAKKILDSTKHSLHKAQKEEQVFLRKIDGSQLADMRASYDPRIV